MSWITFEFECQECRHEFSDLVDRSDPVPDNCPACGSKAGFKKLLSVPAVFTKIVPDYPGAKRRKAGYQHTHANRPAEKKGSQVSMQGTGGLVKK